MNTNLKEQAKRVIAEIVQQSTGDRLVGKTRLFKAFYLAHLYYATENADYLSEWPIVKMENGPGIDDFATLIAELTKDGVLTEGNARVGPFQAKEYRFVAENWRPLPPAQVDAIQQAVRFIANKRGSQLSDLTHEFSRSWNDAENLGEELSIYFDLLDEDDYEKFKENRTAVQSAIKEVWG